MVKKSCGARRGTRRKMRSRGSKAITRYLQEFEVGQSVNITISPDAKKFPSIKFQGSRGRIVEKKGRGYAVEVKDKNSTKKIFIKPEHLKAIR